MTTQLQLINIIILKVLTKHEDMKNIKQKSMHIVCCNGDAIR